MAKKRNGSSKESLRRALHQQRLERGEPITTPGQQPSQAEIDVTLPSQAEGERELERESKDEVMDITSQMDQSASQGEIQEPKPTPSQAEGERDTIDQDLADKGMGP